VCLGVVDPFVQVVLITALQMSFSLQLQKEVIFFLYLDSNGPVGAGFWITYRLLWVESRGSENVENPQSPKWPLLLNGGSIESYTS
jgi:hypothetical protein